MRTIYKFELEIKDKQTIKYKQDVVTGSKIIHVGLDPNKVPCIWVELEPGDCEVSYELNIVGTGGKIRGCQEHVGSFVQDCFVWHVYL